jgi:hypothetical protein
MKEQAPTLPDATIDAVTALAKALIANQPAPAGQYPAGWSKAKIDATVVPPPPHKWRLVPGRSPDTGATFDMLVVESRTHKEGRVTELRNYRHPAGLYTHESAGGLVPDGMPIYQDQKQAAHLPPGVEPEKASLHQLFLQWRWSNYFQKDLRACIGEGKREQGALRASWCATPEGMKTPWNEGATFNQE